MRQDFGYLDFNYKIEVPQLVLGIITNDSKEFQFVPGRKWLAIAHQTSGHACNQVTMIGTILTPSSRAIELMKTVNNRWLDTDCGVFGTTLAEINEYNTLLQSNGMRCNSSYRYFQEALYPIDCNATSLSILSDDQILPENLDDLIVWKSDLERT